MLLVEDSTTDAELCMRLLRSGGLDVLVERVRTRAEAERRLSDQAFDVVITDNRLEDGSAADVVELARERLSIA